jgi:hypothetical protein
MRINKPEGSVWIIPVFIKENFSMLIVSVFNFKQYGHADADPTSIAGEWCRWLCGRLQVKSVSVD